MLGLQPTPTQVEVAVYLLYAVPMTLYVLWPRSPAAPPRERRAEAPERAGPDPGLIAVKEPR